MRKIRLSFSIAPNDGVTYALYRPRPPVWHRGPTRTGPDQARIFTILSLDTSAGIGEPPGGTTHDDKRVGGASGRTVHHHRESRGYNLKSERRGPSRG